MKIFEVAALILHLEGDTVLATGNTIFHGAACGLTYEAVKVLQILADKGSVPCFVDRIVD